MAEGVYSKVELKRQIAKLSHDLYNNDLQIQSVAQGHHNPKTISELQSVKVDIQKKVVAKEIELEKLNARTRARRGRHVRLVCSLGDYGKASSRLLYYCTNMEEVFNEMLK